MTHEVLHLASKMGVKLQQYAAQISDGLKMLREWGHPSDRESRIEGDSSSGSALAMEELFCMSERSPGVVRETREKASRPQAADIYSPPRVAALLPRDGLYPGISMDITTNDELGKPWDFDDPRQRQRARERLRADKSLVLIGSPMCTAFCRLQSINFCQDASGQSAIDLGTC